jgi:hypothetical protein
MPHVSTFFSRRRNSTGTKKKSRASGADNGSGVVPLPPLSMAGGPARAGRSQRAFLQLVHAALRRHGPGLVSSVPIRYDRCPAPHPMYKVRRPLHRTHPSSAPSHFISPNARRRISCFPWPPSPDPHSPSRGPSRYPSDPLLRHFV